jgi:AraC family transcriptional regulator, glycine betaine-responsive activator
VCIDSVKGTADGPVQENLQPAQVCLLLLPNFSLMGVIAAIDVMRHANRLSGRARYMWWVCSVDGAAVKASNDLELTVEGPPDPSRIPDFLFVCGGFNPERFLDPAVFRWLRTMARQSVRLGAITTGTYVLARAGLLKGYACTIHWENATSFVADFPDIELRNNLYVIDRDRYTCSGATATLDMFLHIVSEAHGATLAMAIAEALQVDRIRSAVDEQTRAHRIAALQRSSKLAAAIAAMESNLDEPLTIDALAHRAKLTRRQLHRLFRHHTEMSPTEYYRDLRLRHARLMTLNTNAPILEIAERAGFSTHSHFTRCYRRRFGIPPRADRLNT